MTASMEVYKRDRDDRTVWRLSYDDGTVTVELPGVPIDAVRVNGQHYAPAPEPPPLVVRDGIGGPVVAP